MAHNKCIELETIPAEEQYVLDGLDRLMTEHVANYPGEEIERAQGSTLFDRVTLSTDAEGYTTNARNAGPYITYHLLWSNMNELQQGGKR